MLNLYQEAIEKSNIISKTDVNGVITFVNDEFCKISGYTKEELISQKHNIVRHPDVVDAKFKDLWQTIMSKNIYKATVKNRAKDGTTFFVNTTVIPILNENEEIEEFVAIRYDVTKEMFYKEALEKKEEELKELNRNLKEELTKNEEKQQVMFWQSRLASLGEILANIAHQWRQPLTELNLTIFTLKKAALKGKMNEVDALYCEGKNIIQNMSQTMDDFSNFFKPSKKRYLFNVNESIADALNILDRLIVSETIEINVEGRDIVVVGVSNELSQVILNLVKNSIDAFVQNDITQRVITIKVEKNMQELSIELEDNAGGIQEKNIYRIFEPYFTTKHTSVGTGLGLFISKMICEKGFYGSMDVKSHTDTTTFIIRLPLEEGAKI